MDMTPDNAEGRQLITSYGDGLFRISGQVYRHPVLITPEGTTAWAVENFSGLTVESLQPLIEHTPKVEVLLFGCGKQMALIPSAIKAHLRDHGISCDPMDTGAAARTYNILMTEGRRVAAALIPV